MLYSQDKEAKAAFKESEETVDIALLQQFVMTPFMLLSGICILGVGIVSKLRCFSFHVDADGIAIGIGILFVVGAVVVWFASERQLKSIPSDHYRRIIGEDYGHQKATRAGG